MQTQQKPGLTHGALIWGSVGLIGLIPLGVGAATFFGGADFVPMALRFEHYSLAMMLIGVALQIPIFVIASRTSRTPKRA